MFGHRMRAEWALDPDILYLNHGTVGATPRRVLARQQAIRDEMEKHRARHGEELQTAKVAARDDTQQMQATIAAMRAELEKLHGR